LCKRTQKIRFFTSTHERKPSLPPTNQLAYPNLGPGDGIYLFIIEYKREFQAHFLNDDLNKKICHRLVTQQLSQITNGSFDNKNFWATFNNIMPTSSNTNKAPSLPNHMVNNAKLVETQTKKQLQEETQNYQNPTKFIAESHEINISGSVLKMLNNNNEVPRGLETGSGMDKGIKSNIK